MSVLFRNFFFSFQKCEKKVHQRMFTIQWNRWRKKQCRMKTDVKKRPLVDVHITNGERGTNTHIHNRSDHIVKQNKPNLIFSAQCMFSNSNDNDKEKKNVYMLKWNFYGCSPCFWNFHWSCCQLFVFCFVRFSFRISQKIVNCDSMVEMRTIAL